MSKSILLIVAVALSLLVPTAALAQGEIPGFPTDDDVNAIAKKLYCPVCPNTPLDVCETQACKDWRSQIKDQLVAGWEEEQIMDYFVTQYGERVLAEPQRSGFTSFVWILPILATIVAVSFGWQVLHHWKKSGPASNPLPATDISREVLERVERELRELEG